MIDLVLKKLKIAALNPMQKATLARFNKANNLVLLSPTGSGKTLAFLLCILKQLKRNEQGIQAMILAPSRELALQIEQVFKTMDTGYKVNCCYGGHDMKIEKNNLSTPPSVLIGTPGRISDHIRRGHVDLTPTKMLVLDEFDKALELGFENEMSFILSELDNLSHRVLTSATQLNEVPDFVGLHTPSTLDFTTNEKKQRAYITSCSNGWSRQVGITCSTHLSTRSGSYACVLQPQRCC